MKWMLKFTAQFLPNEEVIHRSDILPKDGLLKHHSQIVLQWLRETSKDFGDATFTLAYFTGNFSVRCK